MGDWETDVPMLVTELQPALGGKRVSVNGFSLTKDSPTVVLCSMSSRRGAGGAPR